MKLTEAQIAAVEDQIGSKAIPDDDEAAASLKGDFGDHTFYLDPNGLHIFERGESADHDGAFAVLVQIAEWTDEARTTLSPIKPNIRPVTLNLTE